MTKFQIGKVYRTTNNNYNYPYLCIRRTDKTVWFCDLLNPEDIFRRKIEGHLGNEYSNSNIPDTYFLISSEKAYEYEEYSSYLLKKKNKIQNINRINRICGDNLLDKDGHLGWWVDKSWKKM